MATDQLELNAPHSGHQRFQENGTKTDQPRPGSARDGGDEDIKGLTSACCDVCDGAGTETDQPHKPDSARDGGTEDINALTSASCDVCDGVLIVTTGAYCRLCKQKLCKQCSDVHRKLTATKEHATEICWPKSRTLYENQQRTLTEKYGNISKVASCLQERTGLQICQPAYETSLHVLAPSDDILDILFQDIEGHCNIIADNGRNSPYIKNGRVCWVFTGYLALMTRAMLRDDVAALGEPSKHVDVSYSGDTAEHNDTDEPQDSNTDKMATSEESSPILIISCSFDTFPAIKHEVGELSVKVKRLYEITIERPSKDELRVKLFVMAKKLEHSVACSFTKSDTGVKLSIRGMDKEHVKESEKAFLNLFCKECSQCHVESSQPVYLECKHVLCHDCVTKARRESDVTYSLCPDGLGRVSKVRSLQVQCLGIIEEMATPRRQEKSMPGPEIQAPQKPEQKRISHGKQQRSTKVPKFLLQRWSRQTGGLTRLRSLLQNDYGFNVAGSDDNLKIYGDTDDILDLAIHSLQRVNEKPPENGLTCTLRDRLVIWRFRGDNARISYFLFNKELRNLVDRDKSVELQCFTDFRPPVVDVKCPYDHYTEVKYKIDELVNAMSFLHEDEFIQPKSFYYNMKVREFIESKRTNENVFCDLRDRNNRNVIVIKTRRKEFINITKDEIANW